LLNAPFATKPKSFDELGNSPPPESYADHDGRRYPVLDRVGSVDPQLLWGSYQLAVQELAQDEPTRLLLTEMARKHRIGIYNDEWEKSPPAPEFLLSRQWAIGTVERFREIFSGESRRSDPDVRIAEQHAPLEPSPTYKPDDPQRIRIKSMEEYPQALLRELETLQRATRNPSQRLGIETALRLIRKGAYIEP